MTGRWIALALLVAVSGVLAAVLRRREGRVRAVRGPARIGADELGGPLGAVATFVQFSSAVCAPCRVTHRVLSQITAADEGVVHVDLDAETRLDLVEQFGITRTPTVLLLDRAGVVRHRIVGAARAPQVLEALEGVAGRTAA